MSKFLAALTGHLSLIPVIASAVQTFKQIGHTKESTLAKVTQIVETSAGIGEAIPVPVVSQISGTVEAIVEGVFGTQPPTNAAPAQ